MKVAILCPGPSLVETGKGLEESSADLFLAVNLAITYWRPDWWVFGDRVALERTPIEHRDADHLCVPLSIRPWIQRHNPGFDTSLCWESLRGDWPVLPDLECNFSTIAALFLARRLGATHIELYGCDMAGTGGIGSDDSVRTEARWIRERAHFDQATKALSGILIDRK
jgi:hypothetical protein